MRSDLCVNRKTGPPDSAKSLILQSTSSSSVAAFSSEVPTSLVDEEARFPGMGPYSLEIPFFSEILFLDVDSNLLPKKFALAFSKVESLQINLNRCDQIGRFFGLWAIF